MAFGTLAPARTMENFVSKGGVPLSGTIVPAGNKNAALPALAACLLTEEDVVLRNIPRIRDVEAMLGLLRSEEHTSELQSRQYLVCRLLLEKKKLPSRSEEHTSEL